MGSCAIRCGFFVLRDCGEPATQRCTGCGRPACAAHALPGPEGPTCLDCRARQADAEGEREDGDWSDGDVYALRHSFYTGAGYGPLYGGGRRDPVYDGYDVRGFAPGAGGDEDDWDDEGPARFADS